jgi:predicted type IV restriction endonuclease
VCPEYDADFAIRKAGQKEKVDIAILLGGVPRIYVEVKPLEEILDGHSGQLARYFNATSTVTLGILTNGLEWRFYTDTGNPNVMDAQPFHVAKLDATDQGLEVLARFAKPVFSAEAIRDYATELRYTAQIAAFLRQQLDLKDREPSESFIRWVLKTDNMYEGIVNHNVIDRFCPIVKDALTRVIREIVRRSISAMEKEAAQPVVPVGSQSQPGEADSSEPIIGLDLVEPLLGTDAVEVSRRCIETTERELRVFEIVKNHFDKSSYINSQIFDTVIRKDVPVVLSYKDTTGYFGIFFNKPSYWIMRVSIEGRRNWVGFNVDEGIGSPLIPEGMVRLDPHPYATFRVQITSPDDVEKLQPIILAAFENTINEHSKTKNTGE